MAIKLNTQEQQVLVDLIQVNDNKKRYITYLGIAEAITSKLIQQGLEENQALNLIKLNKIADQLGELAILDKTLFISCLRRVYDFKTDTTANDNVEKRVGTATCIYDVLGITKHFTNDDIFNINRYFDIYKNAVMSTVKIIKIVDGELTI